MSRRWQETECEEAKRRQHALEAKMRLSESQRSNLELSVCAFVSIQYIFVTYMAVLPVEIREPKFLHVLKKANQ